MVQEAVETKDLERRDQSDDALILHFWRQPWLPDAFLGRPQKRSLYTLWVRVVSEKSTIALNDEVEGLRLCSCSEDLFPTSELAGFKS